MSLLKSLLFGKSSSRSNLRGHAYDHAIARDPPVQGSYPVAGNGPNVLDEIQRSRGKRESRSPSEAAAVPDIPRYREDHLERPRTALNDRYQGVNGDGNVDGRTRSEFSMKSPPNFFSSSSRRTSLRSAVEPTPIPTPLVQSPTPRPLRDVQTYQPRKASETEQYSGGFVSTFAHHNRTDSRSSHKSHVDLLEAHSNIRPSREVSQHRVKASGVRNYGEDVAVRNMNPRDREPRLDLNSPEFSYLKTVYSPKKRIGLAMDGHSRTSSALGHVLGHDTNPSDDIRPHSPHAKAESIRSTTTALRPGVPYPTDSPSVYSISTNSGHDDDRATNGNLAHDRRRALSPLLTSSVQESGMRETLRQPGSTPDRGRRLLREPPLVVPEPKQSLLPKVFKQSASVPRVATVPEDSQPIPTHEIPASNSRQRRRTMSTASQTTPNTTNDHHSKGSYSTFPTTSDRSFTISPTSQTNKQSGKPVEERSEPISLEGIVDLSNSVDTDVTTKTLPGTYPPIPTISIHRVRPNISRPLSTSRSSVRSGRSSHCTAYILSPLHVSPHEIMQPPSFPPENWPLTPNLEIGKSAANMRQ